MWRELQPAVLRYLRVAAPTAAEDLAAAVLEAQSTRAAYELIAQLPAPKPRSWPCGSRAAWRSWPRGTARRHASDWRT